MELDDRIKITPCMDRVIELERGQAAIRAELESAGVTLVAPLAVHVRDLVTQRDAARAELGRLLEGIQKIVERIKVV